MGEWLELGLGSLRPDLAAQQNDANLRPVTFTTEDCSRLKKERTGAGFNLCRSNDAEKIMCASVLHTPNQQLLHDHRHFSYGETSQVFSSYSYLDGNRFFSSPGTEFPAQYTLYKHPSKQFEERNGGIIFTSDDKFPCQNSGQSAVVQNVRERIQARGQYRSWNGDFAEWTGGKKLLLNGMTAGNTQNKTPQCMQPLFMCESKLQFPSTSAATILYSTENANVAKPSRNKADVWFMLQVAPTKNGERLLPQIPKTYLRIKDETITILLVQKYLANKLGLESESEIEITCKGKAVLPFLTLQQVRDEIWFASTWKEDGERNSRDKIIANHASVFSNDYLMILNYRTIPTSHRLSN